MLLAVVGKWIQGTGYLLVCLLAVRMKTGRRTNVGNKVMGQRPKTTIGSVRVNKFNASGTRRSVPKGIRRAPIGDVPKGYVSVDKMSVTAPLSVRKEVLPTILPVARASKQYIGYSHDVPVPNDWSKLFTKSKILVKTKRDLKRKRKEARMPKNTVGAEDVDGDGLVDEVEINLAKILRNVKGEDLDGDGVVTEEETRACRIAKGKQIYAETFVNDFPGIRNFWKPYRHLNDDQIIHAITDNQDFAVNMNNMLLAGRQYKCQASTRMAHALTNKYGTNGLDHLLFDQRTQAQRQKARKQALFRQARSRHAEKILPTNFDFRKK